MIFTIDLFGENDIITIEELENDIDIDLKEKESKIKELQHEIARRAPRLQIIEQ
jgi:hypothetical protein